MGVTASRHVDQAVGSQRRRNGVTRGVECLCLACHGPIENSDNPVAITPTNFYHVDVESAREPRPSWHCPPAACKSGGCYGRKAELRSAWAASSPSLPSFFQLISLPRTQCHTAALYGKIRNNGQIRYFTGAQAVSRSGSPAVL